MNLPNLMNAVQTKISTEAKADSLVNDIGQWLGISGDPQGFFLYLLIMIGIFAIIVILIYNWYEEKRFNKHVDSSFSTIEQDALLDEDQQEFLDKFASTTGVLSDDAANLDIENDSTPFEDDDRSIEEVYSDLVDTMAKRKRDKEEPAGVTIDHHTVEVMPEPDLTMPEMPDEVIIDITEESESVLIMPEVAEVAETHTEEPVTTVAFTEESPEAAALNFEMPEIEVPIAEESPIIQPEDNIPELPVEEIEEAKEEIQPPIEPLATASVSDPINDESVTEESAEIKDIINRAFKEKYNPNYNAEMEALDRQEEAREQVINAQQQEESETQSSKEAENLAALAEEAARIEASNHESVESDNATEDPTNTYKQLLEEDKPERAGSSEPLQPTPAFDKADAVEQQAQDSQQEPATTVEKSESAFSHELPALLNQHIDMIATIESDKITSSAFILESFSAFHNQFDLPVFAFLQTEQSNWLLLNDVREDDIARYVTPNKPVQITLSMQMANRNGPAPHNNVQRFQNSIDEIATTMGATPNWIDVADPADRSGSLDAFCIDVDKTMFFHIVNNSTPFTGIKLKGLLEAQNMLLERDGAYKYYHTNEDGQKNIGPEFTLFNRENHMFSDEMLNSSVVKAVTMQLDIPMVSGDADALDRMVLIARDLETNLNAQLVDDKNRAITEVHLARIRDQIKSIHSAMQLRGIAPGSTHALRLFS